MRIAVTANSPNSVSIFTSLAPLLARCATCAVNHPTNSCIAKFAVTSNFPLRRRVRGRGRPRHTNDGGNCERTFKQNAAGLMVDVVRGFDGFESELASLRGGCFAASTGHAFHYDRQGWPAGDVRASWLHRVQVAGRVISLHRVANAALEWSGWPG